MKWKNLEQWIDYMSLLFQLTNRYTCVNFMVEEEMQVSNPKDAFVHVYDYYDTGENYKRLLHSLNISVLSTSSI